MSEPRLSFIHTDVNTIQRPKERWNTYLLLQYHGGGAKGHMVDAAPRGVVSHLTKAREYKGLRSSEMAVVVLNLLTLLNT